MAKRATEQRATKTRQRMRAGGRRRYFARRPQQYGDVQLDQGQVLVLTGKVNDEKLDRLGYIRELPAGSKTFQCRHCKFAFISLRHLDLHGHKRHEPKRQSMPANLVGKSVEDLTMEELSQLQAIQRSQDHAIDREEKRLDDEAPLYMDQTAASRA